jgi:hypothetical protein
VQKDELGGAQSAARQEKLLFQFDGDGTKNEEKGLQATPLAPFLKHGNSYLLTTVKAT